MLLYVSDIWNLNFSPWNAIFTLRALCNKHAESYAKLKALQARNSYAQIEHLYIFFQQVQNSQGSK